MGWPGTEMKFIMPPTVKKAPTIKADWAFVLPDMNVAVNPPKRRQ